MPNPSICINGLKSNFYYSKGIIHWFLQFVIKKIQLGNSLFLKMVFQKIFEVLLINKNNNMSTFNENSYQRAKERVETIKGFYGNLLAYIIVIPALFWLNYHTSNFNWAIFPAIGWGFGLLVNGLQAYNLNPFLGRDWEDRKIKELMNKDNF